MGKDPSFPFYAQDFLTGVMHLTMEERGVYITLLAYQWAHSKIPKKRVGLIVALSWDSVPSEVKEKFVEDDDYIWNERLEFEREKRKKFKEKQALNGKKGGRPRKSKNPNETQTQSQKKPLENESENEKEYEYEKEIEKEAVIFPFETEVFEQQWEQWKIYKAKEFRFKYKSLQSEQAALAKLNKLASDENQAIAIIHQSMENGWKGFFELKQNNGQTNNTTGIYSEDFKKRIADGLVSQDD